MRTESTSKRSPLFIAWVRATATLTTHTGKSPDAAGSPKQRKRAKALRRVVRWLRSEMPGSTWTVPKRARRKES